MKFKVNLKSKFQLLRNVKIVSDFDLYDLFYLSSENTRLKWQFPTQIS